MTCREQITQPALLVFRLWAKSLWIGLCFLCTCRGADLGSETFISGNIGNKNRGPGERRQPRSTPSLKTVGRKLVSVRQGLGRKGSSFINSIEPDAH